MSTDLDTHRTAAIPHVNAEPMSALRAFFASVADRANSPIDILFGPGDSITEGAGASAKANRYQDLVRDGLRAKWQPVGVAGGEGYVPAYSYYNNRVTTTGTVTQPSTNGLGLLGITLSAGATATLTFTGTALDVFVTKASGGGTLTVAVDGATTATGFATIATANATTVYGSATRVGGLNTGSHTVTFTASTASVIFEGAMVYNGDETKGIRIWNNAHSGQSVSGFTGGSAWVGAISTIKPSLLVVMLGTNDWRGATGPASGIGYAQGLVSAINQARAACTVPPSVLLILPYKPATGTNTTLASYQTFLKAALTVPQIITDVAVMNLYALMGAESLQGAQLGLLSADNIHPSDKGHRFIADAVLRKLGA